MKLLKIFILSMLLLVACSKEATEPLLSGPVPIQTIHNVEKGLSLVLDEDSFIGSPSIIGTTIRNDSEHDYQFGDFYSIEQKKEDKWYALRYSDAVFYKNPQFKDFGSLLSTQNDSHQTFSIDDLGLILVPGDYRLIKTFLSTGPTSYEISIAEPFTVK